MPVVWRGLTLAANQIPPADVAQQILWELFEVNFRYDLLVLDRACYDLKPKGFDAPRPGDEDGQVLPYDELDASSFGDRQMRVVGAIPHFKSRMVPEDTDEGHNGFW
ncbi:hypothetical protein BDZ89DRAFT_96333 [Hymenopellis radicata]|nr:hypothetical protein BDZ89DRAFT_96333 [Hymenopellis radicata]